MHKIRLFHKLKICILFVLAALFVLSDGAYAKTSEWARFGYIAHGCGAIDGCAYTNSLDALDASIKSGVKVVEMDFRITDDQCLVCSHDPVKGLTKDEFLSQKIEGKYTPMTAETALRHLMEAGDVYLVVDAKKANIAKIYKEIDRLCVECGGSDYRKMIIPQFYQESDLDKLKKIYNYSDYIFTTYKLPEMSVEEYEVIAMFCKKNNVGTITIPKRRVSKELIDMLKSYGLTVAVHTINDEEKHSELTELGVDVIYTDILY